MNANQTRYPALEPVPVPALTPWMFAEVGDFVCCPDCLNGVAVNDPKDPCGLCRCEGWLEVLTPEQAAEVQGWQ